MSTMEKTTRGHLTPHTLHRSGSKGRLLLLGHPALSPVESLDSNGTGTATTPIAFDDTTHPDDDYLTARYLDPPSTPKSTMRPASYADTSGSSAPRGEEGGIGLPGRLSMSHIRERTFDLTSSSASTSNRRSTFSKLQPFHFARIATSAQAESPAPSPSSSTDSLWGTPVDATAIKMGLVEPPSPDSTSPEASSSLEDTATSSGDFSPNSNQSIEPSLTVGEADRLADVKETADSALATHGDVVGAIRKRAMNDLSLLLSKSLQRQCDLCEQGTGLWVWTWSSQLLCLSCLALATHAISADVKENLLARRIEDGATDDVGNTSDARECSAPDDSPTNGHVDVNEAESTSSSNIEIDRQMLSRVCNALPHDTLVQLIEATRRHMSKAVNAANIARRRRLSEASEGEDSFLDFAPDRTIRGALGRFAAKKGSQVRNSTLGGPPGSALVSTRTPASDPSTWLMGKTRTSETLALGRKLSKTSSKLGIKGSANAAALALQLEAAEERRRNPPRDADNGSSIGSVSSIKLPSALFYPEHFIFESMTARSFDAGDMTSPPLGNPLVDSPIDRRFRVISSLFVGMLTAERGNGEERVLRVSPDEALVCTWCPSSTDHPAGTIVLGTEKAYHVDRYHPGHEPDWLLIGPDRGEETGSNATTTPSVENHVSRREMNGDESVQRSTPRRALKRRSRSQPFFPSSIMDRIESQDEMAEVSNFEGLCKPPAGPEMATGVQGQAAITSAKSVHGDFEKSPMALLWLRRRSSEVNTLARPSVSWRRSSLGAEQDRASLA